jgi:hypothetical protein
MSKKFEEIEIQIENAEKRHAVLKSDITGLLNRLDEKRTEQETAILAEKPTSNVMAEIMSLETELSGTQRALEKQAQILSNFQSDRAAEVRSIGRAQAEKAGVESTQIIIEIYSLVSQAVPRIVELRAKNFEHLKGLRAANPTERLQSTRTSKFINSLEIEIQKILPIFPDEIFANKELPTPDELKQSLKP